MDGLDGFFNKTILNFNGLMNYFDSSIRIQSIHFATLSQMLTNCFDDCG